MAVKFYFRKDRYGLEELELKCLTLIHGGTFEQRREILLSIYVLFKVLEKIREGKFADDLWKEVSFEYTTVGKQCPLCIFIEAEELARALENLYNRFARQLMEEWLGYIPPLPGIELIPERTDRVFVNLNKGEAIKISFEGKNRKSSELLYFIDDCNTLSLKDILAECVMDMFDEVFMKVSSEFSFAHTGAVYFPVDRLKLSEIDEPLKLPDRKSVKTKSIRHFYDLIREHIKKQIESWNGLLEEFVKKCVFPITFMWMIRGFRFKEYEEFVDVLLEDRKLVFTEGFVPVLKCEKGEILLRRAKEHIKDMAYLLAALGCLSMGRLFVEDVDRLKGYDHQDIIRMLFDKLLGFDSVFAPPIRKSRQLFATCEKDYLPWHFEGYDEKLTGIYGID